MNEIPVYEAYINDCEEGIMNISLVDYPAVESNFVAFAKDKVFQSYTIQDEEQHIIYGCLMRADFPIYRRDEMGEYYIKYSKETVKLMAEKLLADGLQNSVNIMHMENSNVQGVQMVELFIKDSSKGVSPNGFEDIEDGSLFAVFKVRNEVIWNAIKDGTFKGYSLEGYFSVRKEENYNKQDNTKSYMSKIKDALKKLLAEFGAIETDKGTLNYEGDIEIGTVVTDNDGNPIEDGEYLAEDKIYVVTEGKIAEIKDAEESTDVEELAEELAEEVAEEPAEEETVEEEPEQSEEPSEVEALKAEIEVLRADLEALKESVAEILSQPVADPIAEQFEKTEIADDKWSRIAKNMR